MSAFGGPNIITDGLVLSLDAGNTKSYPGTGTTWYDKSGNGNNGTLTNGPTFASGSIVFDGVDDYVNISNFDSDILLGQNFTINLWIKAQSNPIDRKVIITNQDDYNTDGWAIAINQQDGYGIRSLFMHVNNITIISDYSNPLPTPNDWNMVTGVWDRNNNTCRLHYNGTQRLTSTQFTSNVINTNNSFRIGAHLSNGNRNYKGSTSTVFFYNRALSSQEILQNYNATKSRFGL